MFGIAALSIPFMTILSRMSGGGKPKLPWGLDQWILPLPYLLFWPVIGWWIVPAYLCAVLGLRLGHGRGFNYNQPFEPGSKPERVEALIPNDISVWCRKFLIMVLTGLAVTLGTSLALLHSGEYFPSLLLFFSGGAKALAYLSPKTEISEYLRGSFLGLGVFLGYLAL